jgi:flagellar biosynthesis regulator FlbT
MPIDTEMEELLDIVKNGSTFEGLRAARQLERLTRKRHLKKPIDTEREELLDIVEHGSTFEALRAARQLNELTRRRRLQEREQANEEKEKSAATK